MINRRLTLISLSSVALVSALPARAMKAPIFAGSDGAINGYDPVAYFTQDKPVKGDPDVTSTYQGAEFRFATADNKALFDADPGKYAPQYGGYCAYAVSKGATAPTVPEAFTVHDGKLYLNFSTDVMGIWRQDIPGNVARADANWPAVLN